MRQPVQVVVYCVRKSLAGREYLLMRRIPSGGGIWQAITGGVEDHEDYFTAALRELNEETGFVPSKIEILDYTYTFPVEESMRKLYDGPVDIITEIVFLAHIRDGLDPVLDPSEHDNFRWCDFESALEMLFWPGNKESLRQCEMFLENKM
jgi:dATP pyrophosphohydrolase